MKDKNMSERRLAELRAFCDSPHYEVGNPFKYYLEEALDEIELLKKQMTEQDRLRNAFLKVTSEDRQQKNKNKTPMSCKAIPKPCPLQQSDLHVEASSLKDAERFFGQQLEMHLGKENKEKLCEYCGRKKEKVRIFDDSTQEHIVKLMCVDKKCFEENGLLNIAEEIALELLSELMTKCSDKNCGCNTPEWQEQFKNLREKMLESGLWDKQDE